MGFEQAISFCWAAEESKRFISWTYCTQLIKLEGVLGSLSGDGEHLSPTHRYLFKTLEYVIKKISKSELSM
jgi:hypothetical protein